MDDKNGLTKKEVEQRIDEGLSNHVNGTKTKTIKEIVIDNVFTYFNILNVVLSLSIIISGIIFHDFWNALKNSLFVGVAICNTVISIIQEILAKKTIDNMSVLSSVKAKVIRDGEEKEIEIYDIVKDDLIKVSLGSQIVCDSIVIEGNVEVNESFITGESKTIQKKKGDSLLSGSFIVSGECKARVTHVGNDNYINTLSNEAKKMNENKSVIFNSFESLVRILSYILIPLGIMLFINQYIFVDLPLSDAIMNTVAALIGMIPEGLVLLTSSVMAVSVLKLSRNKVLVQQLYCIETLARVNCICLDKTGTITTGNMKLYKKIPKGKISNQMFDDILCNIVNLLPDNSSTFNAIRDSINKKLTIKADELIPFSSERKFSACRSGNDCYYVGAPEYVLSYDLSLIDDEIKEYQEDYRVIVIAHRSGDLVKKPNDLDIVGYVLIEDEIRREAKDTLEFFKEQGVKVKIISGDNYKTVTKIASRVGLKNLKGVDTSILSEEEIVNVAKETDIFGRVTPHMKKTIIKALKKNGYTVAMTGDGVNDVLALKESDCSVVMASGSDAAKSVGQLVLLDSNFASMPKIVAEGRQTINNIERSASLLLVKTIYTIFLIFTSIFFQSKFFFVPIQLSLITSCTIGIPSFILALEPNKNLVDGKNFLLKILKKSLPGGITVFLDVVIILLFKRYFNVTDETVNALVVLLTGVTGFVHLVHVSKPFNYLRGILFYFLLAVFIIGVTLLNDFFALVAINHQIALIMFLLIVFSISAYRTIIKLIDKSIVLSDKIHNWMVGHGIRAN